MTKKLSITYKGVTFREGDKVKMNKHCNADGDAVIVNFLGTVSARLLDGQFCFSPSHWQLLPKNPPQKRDSNGRFAGKEKRKEYAKKVIGMIEADNKVSDWKDEVSKSVHPTEGVEVKENTVIIKNCPVFSDVTGVSHYRTLVLSKLEAIALQKKLQLAIERWEQLFNQEKP